MVTDYKPPFAMTDEITNLVIEIGELTGTIAEKEKLSANLLLRRENRIKTIYSSLAIEQNTLSLEQVSDVIGGKRVLAPPQDIREAKNAYEAYETLTKLNPFLIEDLLLAHKLMMADLIKEAGCFRSKGVGVFAGDALIHAGTPAQYIPQLIRELFDWLKESPLHPLIKSCIFHYEFEFIHPFADGNGRTGRLWHTLILSRWKTFFMWLPIETLIHERQNEYYDALNTSNNNGESTAFVEFMLHIIYDVLRELIETPQNQKCNEFYVGTNVGENVGINELTKEDSAIGFLKDNPKITAKSLAVLLNITQRQTERILANLKASGKIERIGASKNGYWKVKDEN